MKFRIADMWLLRCEICARNVRATPFDADARLRDSDFLRTVVPASGRRPAPPLFADNGIQELPGAAMEDTDFGKRKVLPPRGLLIALAAQLPLAFGSLPLRPSTPEFVAGVLLLLAGIAINVWAERRFRRAGVGVCPFSPAPVVVETGAYRFTRNPMYVGLVAINQSAALLCGVPINTWTTLAFAVWLHRAFVVPEERFLRRELGEAYATYSRRVPRWLGPLRGG
jgi:protein-S-isoprenylcysteine O-methyltransferase Ste14